MTLCLIITCVSGCNSELFNAAELVFKPRVSSTNEIAQGNDGKNFEMSLSSNEVDNSYDFEIGKESL